MFYRLGHSWGGVVLDYSIFRGVYILPPSQCNAHSNTICNHDVTDKHIIQFTHFWKRDQKQNIMSWFKDRFCGRTVVLDCLKLLCVPNKTISEDNIQSSSWKEINFPKQKWFLKISTGIKRWERHVIDKTVICRSYWLSVLMQTWTHLCLWTPQILAASLIQCHRKSSADGSPLSLKAFVAGRNRLENDGATALAQAFQVQNWLKSLM